MKWLAFCLLLVPMAARAETDPAVQARSAMQQLQSANALLEAADTARDRVRALTETIQAYEAGLGALREGLRRMAREKARLSQQLQDRDGETAALLAALMHIGARPLSSALFHPAGAAGAARATSLLGTIAPTLDAEAAELRRDLATLQELETLQADAAEQLETGLKSVQAARRDLNAAIASRTDLPRRFTQDPVREAILLASADTLSRFAAGLSRVVEDETLPPPDLELTRTGSLPLPVRGEVVRSAGEPDAAGVARPGILLATRPSAIVTTPSAATIRYAGPLLDFGQVVILEPATGTLWVLAGLGTVYGSAGDLLPAGAAVGLMGAGPEPVEAMFSTDSDDTGAERTETLYIEVRRDNTTEDPKLWFRTDKNG